MQKWEYRKLEAGSPNSSRTHVWQDDVLIMKQALIADYRKYLNQLGGEGWEVINVVIQNGHEISFMRRSIE